MNPLTFVVARVLALVSAKAYSSVEAELDRRDPSRIQRRNSRSHPIEDLADKALSRLGQDHLRATSPALQRIERREASLDILLTAVIALVVVGLLGLWIVRSMTEATRVDAQQKVSDQQEDARWSATHPPQ